MKFFNVKTAIAAVCVVAAGFGGVKAYNAANQSEADLLLAENVEALSAGEGKDSDTSTWVYTAACAWDKDDLKNDLPGSKSIFLCPEGTSSGAITSCYDRNVIGHVPSTYSEGSYCITGTSN